MSQADMMILTTTFSDPEKAREVAHLMVDAGLAVCAQVESEMSSFYQWDGVVKQDSEVRVTFKILGERFDLFCGELKLNHPYEVPQLVAWPASYIDRAYLNWARGKTTDAPKDEDTNI